MKKVLLKSAIILTGSSIMVACNSNHRYTSKTNENMFAVDQIKAAYSKVKSGADFTAYIQDVKKLGVTYYETFVADGHTDYYGTNEYKTTSPAKYEPLTIAPNVTRDNLKRS